MRELTSNEIAEVAGAFFLTLHGGNDGVWAEVKGEFSGGDILSSYDWAVSEATKFFEWWDPAGYYEDSVAGVTL